MWWEQIGMVRTLHIEYNTENVGIAKGKEDFAREESNLHVA